MKYVTSALLFVLLALFSVQGLAETTALAIDLDWVNIPRNPKQKVAKQAKIPGGRIVFIRFDLIRSFDFYMENGIHCSAYAAVDDPIWMECGGPTGHYYLSQMPGKNAELDWIQYEPNVEPPKPKIRS